MSSNSQGPGPDYNEGPRAPSDDEISQRAYELWVERGCPSGDSSHDWFAARSQLVSELTLRTALAGHRSTHDDPPPSSSARAALLQQRAS